MVIIICGIKKKIMDGHMHLSLEDTLNKIRKADG